MKKVALYLTFKKKHDNNFRDYQMRIINDYCLRKKYSYDLYLDIVDNYSDISHRKELNRLKEKIENKEYDTVIIKSMSNLSRNHLFSIDFINFLKNQNCLIESIDNTEINYQLNEEISKIMKKIINEEREELVR